MAIILSNLFVWFRMVNVVMGIATGISALGICVSITSSCMHCFESCFVKTEIESASAYQTSFMFVLWHLSEEVRNDHVLRLKCCVITFTPIYFTE